MRKLTKFNFVTDRQTDRQTDRHPFGGPKKENIWDITSSPPALNHPPQLRVPPQPSGDFLIPPNSAVFRETPTPPINVGGVHTMSVTLIALKH